MQLVRNAVLGAVAGGVATSAMDLLWYRRARAEGGGDDFVTWEFSTPATDFGEDAPAPARVGQLITSAVGIELSDSSVATTNNVVHWLTGVGWGKVAGVAAALLPIPALGVGISTGVVAFATSYALLGAAGIYKPITAYDAATLWKDLSAHLVYGTTLGATLGVARSLRR